MKYRKILVIGPPASWKSTFAEKYSEKYWIQKLHQDQYFFNEEWKAIDHKEAIINMKEIIVDDAWIIEWNYDQVINEFWEKAELIIFLNFNRFFSLWRVIYRKFSTPNIKKWFWVWKIHKLPWHFIKYILFIYPEVQSKQLINIQKINSSEKKYFKDWQEFLKFQEIILSK